MSTAASPSTSSTPPPHLTSRGSTPATQSASTPNRSATSSSSKGTSHKPKPINVFTDDGSFLERFQRMQKEDEEKKKREQELAVKLDFENRFKKRGKKRATSSEPTTENADDTPAKKAKFDPEKPLTAYEKEVRSYTGSLKDAGTGIRPLVK